MVTTQTEAKRFFVEKVLAQARAEDIPLSDAEREMLVWSEVDPDIVIDPALPSRLEKEMSDAEYEKKIAGLLARRYHVDVDANPRARDEWHEARSVLEQGDHYMAILVSEALGTDWWSLWKRLWRTIRGG